MAWKQWARAACVLGGASIAAVVFGADSPPNAEPIRVDYRVTAGCPDVVAFTNRLRAHTTKFRIAATGEPARTFVIDVGATSGSFDGRLSIRDASGASAERTLQGATCIEVVQGLALMTALAIDPTASLTPSVSLPVGSASSAGSSAASVTASSIVPPTPSSSSAASMAHPTRDELHFEVVVSGETVFGLSPDPLFGGSIAFGVDVDRRSIVSPSFRFGLHGDVGPSIATASGAAKFGRFAATIDACPFSFSLGENFTVRPCAQIGGGFVQGVGSDIVDARSAREPWFFASALARLGWSPVTRLRLEVSAGASAPFERYRFRFEPATSIYETASFAGFFDVGVAFVF